MRSRTFTVDLAAALMVSPFPPIADDEKAPVLITDTGPALTAKEAVRW